MATTTDEILQHPARDESGTEQLDVRTRGRRRRVLPRLLIGLGAFFLGIAILFPTVVLSGVKQTPLITDVNDSVSQGSALVYDGTTGELVTYPQMTAYKKVVIDVASSDDEAAVFVASLCVRKVPDPAGAENCHPEDDPDILTYGYDRVATDRLTGEAINAAKYKETQSEGEVDGTKHEGVTYKFPFDMEKDGVYRVYDDANGGSEVADYQGEEVIEGVTTWKYVIDYGEQAGTIGGIYPGRTHNVLTYWVEPNSGIIIKGGQHQLSYFENGDLAADVELTLLPKYQKLYAEKAKEAIAGFRMLSLWIPLGAGLLGASLVVTGLLIERRRRNEGADVEIAGPPEPTGS